MHLRIRIHSPIQLLGATPPINIEDAVVGTDRDAPGTPLGPGPPLLSITSQRWTTLLIIIILGLESLVSKDAPQEPGVTHVIRVYDTAATQLDTLASVVDPEEVEIEGCLNNAEDNGDGVDAVVIGIETTNKPVDTVESAVGAESEEVE